MDLPEDQRLKDISPKAYEHPADRAATAALSQIPMMDTVVRKLIEFGERSIHQQLLAGAVRLGPDQLPEVWASHRAALARLDIDYVPDLYMWQMPFTNAMAIGSKKPMVVLNSGAVSLFDEHEIRTVLGHEAGHILSDHLMYRTSPAAHGKRTVYQNRDIERLFAGLGVTESFLLLNKTREVLLRKKAVAVKA